MFLEALNLVGGGSSGTVVEEGDFTVTKDNTPVPVTITDYDAILCFYTGSSTSPYIILHVEWVIPFSNGNIRLVSDGKGTTSGYIGEMSDSGEFTPAFQGYIAPQGGIQKGTWHYIAIKLNS